MGNEKKWRKRKNIILIIVFALLITSIFYAIYMFIQAPTGVTASAGEKVKIDYFLLSLQCGVGSFLVFLPRKLEDKFKVHIPHMIQSFYLVFLFLAIFLGEVGNFYYHVPNWDRVLHVFSAGMLAVIGFFLFEHWTVDAPSHPLIASFFAFCFAMASGVVWEIYEFMSDSILKTNMQKYISYEREMVVGRKVLFDTMGDLIVNTAGAFVVVVLGYFYLRHELQNVRDK